jgi:putative endonuclease
MAGAIDPPSSVSTTPRVPFVYLLSCRDGSLYAGAAKDVLARLRLHQQGRASRYTRSRLPVVLAWSCEVASWSEALREEHRIKRLSRQAKQALVAAALRLRRTKTAQRRSRSAGGGAHQRSRRRPVVG